jgi:hypothetical protein
MIYWKPSTELYIYTRPDSDIDLFLSEWALNHADAVVTIGPFVNIRLYAQFKDVIISKYDGIVNEYLFLYDSIDNTQLISHMLLLGRDDGVEISG